MLANITGSGDGSVFCRPPDDVLGQVKPDIRSQLDKYLIEMPDQQVLLSPDTGENSSSNGPLGKGLPAGIRLAHLIMRLSPDLPLGFLLLVSLLAVRTLKGWLRWWGIPIFISGLLSLVWALFISASFERGWVDLLASRIPSTLSLGLVTLGHDLARAILQSLTGTIIFTSLLIAVFGIAMWIVSAFVKTPGKPEPPLGAETHLP